MANFASVFVGATPTLTGIRALMDVFWHLQTMRSQVHVFNSGKIQEGFIYRIGFRFGTKLRKQTFDRHRHIGVKYKIGRKNFHIMPFDQLFDIKKSLFPLWCLMLRLHWNAQLHNRHCSTTQ
jgi:hypothetical protein